MTSPTKGKHAPDRVQLSYQLLRNTTSPDEKLIGVQSFVANLPAFEILINQSISKCTFRRHI